jgi:inorganic pyrophosphatase
MLTYRLFTAQVVAAYIEVMRGDANKYEWDKNTGYLTLDR